MIRRITFQLGFRALLLGAALLFSSCGKVENPAELETDEVVSYSRLPSGIKDLDPVRPGDSSSSMAIGKIYEGLLQYHYLARPYKVIPLLAESMPTISEDGLTYTFKIRKGIYFHDDPCFPDGKGREVVAEDFAYSLKRLADAKNISGGFWTINERIVGINDFRDASKTKEPTDYSLKVEGLQALDRYTLQIKLTAPYPQLLDVLTMHYTFVVPHEAVAFYDKSFSSHPVGTGPYELKSWIRKLRIEFVRSPKWKETGRIELYPTNGTPAQIEAGLLDDAGKQIPFVDRIVQFIVQSESTSWMMFLSGQFGFSSISKDNWTVVVGENETVTKTLENRKIRLISAPSLTIRYIGFNFDDPLLGNSNPKNKYLRQALSCAYDFKEINTFLNNRNYPVYGPIPEPLNGYLKDPSPYWLNLEKAKKLLVKAGYPNGIDSKTGKALKLTLEVGATDSDTRQMIAVVVGMFNKIGVKVEPNFSNWGEFNEKLSRRQAQLFMLGWIVDYPDAENFFQLFYSKNASPGPNHTNYRNSEFDRLYEKIRPMTDSPERTALYEKMAHLLVEEAPWIYCYQQKDFALKHCWVKNYISHDFPYGMGKYRRIDVKQRREWLKKYKNQKINMSGTE